MRYIDTNVILRYLVEKKEKQPKNLKKLFVKLESGEIKVECLEIVFFQVIFVLKSFYKIDKKEIIKGIKNLLLLSGFHIKNKQIMERTLDIWETYSDDIVDCYIAANMEYANERELFTYDKGIKQLGIKGIEP